jgi:predicted regulator of Ras-like GTPase activity (Roadblock/LC7/MglB family)
MEKQTKRLILLFSLILVIIPMVIFPRRMGMPLASGSAVYMLYEFVYYGVVLYLLRKQTSLVTILIGSALTLVYRMALGAALGLTIVIMYGMNSTIAFSLGMAKYLPAIILHVIAAPFVIRSVYLGLAENLSPGDISGRRQFKPIAKPRSVKKKSGMPFPAPSVETQASKLGRVSPIDTVPAAAPHAADENQFERAVKYIGESGAVKLALLVNEEGLPLACFSRCEEDIELWAPLANILEKNNRALLHRYHRGGEPERIDIGTKNMRIFLRHIDSVTLMILAEQNVDETILIRIAQATDMIHKYISDRYSPALFARVEERYVSNS